MKKRKQVKNERKKQTQKKYRNEKQGKDEENY